MNIKTEMIGKTIVELEVIEDDRVFTQEIRLWINEFEYIKILGNRPIELCLMGVEENGDHVILEPEILEKL